MRALLASPLGFLIGVSLGALGGGGSILAVPALVYVAGQDAKQATTTSLFVVGFAALWGMVGHLGSGHVRVRPGIVFGAVGIGGSFAGSHLNSSVDPDVLLLAFAGLMLVAAWRLCAKSCRVGDVDVPWSREEPRTTANVQGQAAITVSATTAATRTTIVLSGATIAKVVAAGTAVGFLTGFFGVGGGFVIVPALVLALGFAMPEAVGTSLLVIAINSAFALTQRVSTTGIAWRYAGPFTLAALAGVSVGTRFAHKLPAATLARWFVGLLVVVALYTAVRSTMAL